MILESIVIQDFRKLADKLVIDGFEPGLNIIAGPNEAGKSTIAEASARSFSNATRSRRSARLCRCIVPMVNRRSK